MNRELEKKLYEKYISQGIDCRTATYRASDGVRKYEQKKYTKEFFVGKLLTYQQVKTACENIVLRPNDLSKKFGTKGFKNYMEILEEVLENYKSYDIYNYYYDMKDNEHSYHNLDRWLKWGRK